MELELIVEDDFSCVGGNEVAKKELQRLAKAIANDEVYARFGITPPKGILLHGPPGNGKTLMARAFVNEINKFVSDNVEVRFVEMNFEDFASKWYGETTTNMKKYFDVMEEEREKYLGKGIEIKYVVYMGELDSIGADRDSTHEASQKFFNVLLKQMDGFNQKSGYYFLGDTNKINLVDKALIRPGRFTKLISVNHPKDKEIDEIFAIHLNKYQNKALDTLFTTIDYSNLRSAMCGYSGAEIEEVVRSTIEGAMWDTIESGVSSLPLKTSDFLDTIKNYGIKKVSTTKRKMGYEVQNDGR